MLTILVTPLISAALIALFLRRQGNLAAGVSGGRCWYPLCSIPSAYIR